MKTSRVDKLEAELHAEEEKLRLHLLRVLPGAADRGSDVFSKPEFNPSNLHPYHFYSDAETSLVSAKKCIRLREATGLDVTGSSGALFPGACEEHSSKNQQRRGPRKLATLLLDLLAHGA